MPTVKVVLAVIQARKLPARDFNGFSDPYADVSVVGAKFAQQRKTAVVNKNLSPSWNETFTFLLNDSEAQYASLKLRVWDKDSLSDDYIGEVVLPLYKVKDDINTASDTWYPLVDKSGHNSGKLGDIQLRVGVSADNLPDSSQERLDILMSNASVYDTLPVQEAAFSQKEILGANVNAIDGLLSFEVLKATDLPNNGNDFVPFNCDAFYVVSFAANTFRSRVIKHNLNPAWDERVMLLVRERERNYQIKISVYDHDVLGKNRLIGSAQVLASDFTSKKTEVQKMLKLDLVNPIPPDNSKVTVRGKFVSYHELKRQLWSKLASNFDLDENKRVNRVEFGAILDSLGSSLSDADIEKIFKKHAKVPASEGAGELEMEQESLIEAMDEIAKGHKQALITLDRNPFNGTPLSKDSEEAIVQLALSCAQDSSKLDQFVIGGLLTESYASKGWFSQITNYIIRGKYQLGEDNANILVQDRRSGLVQEEKIQTFVRLGIRVLYQNGIRTSHEGLNSATVRNLFIKQSIKQGLEYDNPKSASHIIPFAKYHNLNLAENLLAVDEYKNFNEFFYRKLKPMARVAASPDPRVLLSPADCRCMVFPTIKASTELWIKGEDFTVGRLFADEELGKQFEGGVLCIFRLAPQDYHRFHSPATGKFKKLRQAGMHLFTVNPMAVRENFPVYTENKRFVTTIDTAEFGKIAYIIIGAMMVGSINLTVKDEQDVKRMDELGYFAFGGSTIICVFQPNKLQLDADLVANSNKCLETLIRVGDSVGRATH